jgi:hypothetical protein
MNSVIGRACVLHTTAYSLGSKITNKTNMNSAILQGLDNLGTGDEKWIVYAKGRRGANVLRQAESHCQFQNLKFGGVHVE